MSDPRPAVRRVGWSAPRVFTWALGVGLLGLVGFVVGVLVNPPRAYFAYLTAYVFVLGIVLGAMALVMIERLVAATWFVAISRIAESVASAVPVMAVLFIPIALGARWLYPWTDVSQLEAHARELVARKTAYLNLPFFFVRAGCYFVSWIVVAELLRRWSTRQDREPGRHWNARLYALSAPGVIVLAFTLTFAAFDWVMSLTPTWFSTIFGVQIFAGAMVGTLALLAALVALGEADGSLAGVVTEDHFSAIGKLLFTFVIFWAYVSFAQLLIIWIANLPDEVIWYVPRIRGAWLVVAIAVALGQFAVPFLLLLSHDLKRHGATLRRIGIAVLVVHYVEVYWMVIPQVQPASAWPHWTDAAALAAVGALTLACASWRARDVPAVPLGDPALAGALRYHET